MRLSSLLTVMLLLPGQVSSAEIYRCAGTTGEPLFSQRPCGDSGVRIVLQARPGREGEGLRPSERAWLEDRERAANPGHRKRRAPRPRYGPGRKPAARQAYQCERRRHALDAVRTELRRGYKPARGERLRRRRRVHEDYLAAFCP